MKIAVICDVLGEANNGTTIAALNLIRTLREKGHEVRVVCPDADRAGEPGYYIVPKYDFHIFNEYVEKNGVAPAKLDTRVPEAAIHDVDVIHVMIPFALGKAAAHYAHDHGIALTRASIVRPRISPTIFSCKTVPRPTLPYTIYYMIGSTATATASTTPPSSSRIPLRPLSAPPMAG